MSLRFRTLFLALSLLLLSAISAAAQEKTALDKFRNALDGSWVKKEKDGSSTIINYNYSSNDIIMFSDALGVQEVYLCSQLSPTVRDNTWYMVGTNDMVPFIKMNITVRLESDDVCMFTVREDGIKNAEVIWTGRYTRMVEYSRQKPVPEAGRQFVLDGRYTNDDYTMVFSKSHFSLTDDKGEHSGLAALFRYEDITVLELRFLGKEGKLENLGQYRFDHSITETDDSISVAIMLTPGRIKIHGFKPSGESILTLTQEIAKEKPEE